MGVRDRLRLQFLRSTAALVSPQNPPDGAASRRILVMRPDHLGDLLLSLPALQQLRSAFPQSHLGLLVGSWNEELARRIPYVDEVMTLDVPWFDRQPKGAPWEPYILARREAERIGRQDWDMAIVLRPDFWWGAQLAVWAGIPQRIGYGFPETIPFLTRVVQYHPLWHEASLALNLVKAVTAGRLDPSAALPDPRLALTPGDEEYAARWWEEQGRPPRMVVVHPGAGAPVKQWRADRFRAVAGALAKDMGATVLVTGGPGEEGLAAEVAGGGLEDGHLRLVGASLGQLAAVLQHSVLAVGVDSGVMHLAAAVGVPTVRLYGPVDAARFGPWGSGERHAVVRSPLACVPCNRLDFSTEELSYHPCVRSISVEQVMNAVRSMMPARSTSDAVTG